jgi:glutamate-1-semialdehyde 2,1-aminomutase
MKKNQYVNSTKLLERALKTIPLASQTFSKSITQFPPGISPLFISHGKGSHVWDEDGNEYIDFINGLAAVSIGYADKEINDAVKNQLDNGIIFSLPHKLEMEVAEMMVSMIPCAEKVRFGKNGTDATSASIRLARAYTGKEHVLVCGYHGWQDWYIGTTSRDLGVPTAVKNLTHKFEYNNFNNVVSLFEEFQDNIAAVIMEPMNISWPKDNFLKNIQEICKKNKSLLIFDETITGFRFSNGGAQELFDVCPDLATFGKGMGNGFPISAVVGSSKVMKYMEEIFFSGTFGGETASLSAVKAVINKIKTEDIVKKLSSVGAVLMDGIDKIISKYKAENFISIGGHPSWSILVFHDTKKFTSWEIKTLFFQEMFKRGILTIGSHNISASHSLKDIEKALDAYDYVIKLLSVSISDESLINLLEVDPIEPLFKVR